MRSTVETKLGISLDVGVCTTPSCAEFAWPLYRQMDSGKYDEMSVVNLQPLEDWRADHRTARKRADRAGRRGYEFAWIDRSEWEADITAINRSTTHRQGRPMTEGYVRPVSYEPLPIYPCNRHAIRCYGVLDDDTSTLVAYAFIYRAGELALISQILGHDQHLENEVMWLLMQGVMRAEHAVDPHGYLVYNRWDSGTDGLRFFKEHCGFVPMAVEWCP